MSGLEVVHIPILRTQPRQPTPSSNPKLGVATRDITPSEGHMMAGYSLSGRRAGGVGARLYARAMYLEDSRGNALAICFCDLHSGTRYIHERVASLLAPRSPIGVHNLLLSGTHTHTGPGQIYGNALYDLVAQASQGFNQQLADWIADRIARAIYDAYTNAVAGDIKVGFADEPVWGWTANRSIDAFNKNVDASEWNDDGWPGENCSETSAKQKSVDPRVRVLAAKVYSSNIAVFSTFSCHATTIGPGATDYHHDWPGVAVEKARSALVTGTVKPAVAMALSGAGDINGLLPGKTQGLGLADALGARVAEAVAKAARKAFASAQPLESIESSFLELEVSKKLVDADEKTKLAKHWRLGTSTLAGAEDAATGIPCIEEGQKSDAYLTSDPPQHPKDGVASYALSLLGFFVAEPNPSPILPIHLMRVNDSWITGIPMESTCMAAHRIERTILSTSGAARAQVVGYSGDYSGYLTTREEFEEQHYEGSSTLWGKNSLAHFRARIEEAMHQPPRVDYGTVTYQTVSKVEFPF